MVSCFGTRAFAHHLRSLVGQGYMTCKGLDYLPPAAQSVSWSVGSSNCSAVPNSVPASSRTRDQNQHTTAHKDHSTHSTGNQVSSWRIIHCSQQQWHHYTLLEQMPAPYYNFGWLKPPGAQPLAAAAAAAAVAVQKRCLHASPSVARKIDVDYGEEALPYDEEEDEPEVYLDEDESEELDSEWVDDGSVITTHHDSDEDIYDVEFDEAWEGEEEVDDLSAEDLSDDERQ